MMRALNYCTAFVIIIFLSQSCMEEEFGFDKVSKDLEINPEFIFPIGFGSLSILDIVKQNDTVRFNGDSIEIYISQDTIFTLGGEDFFDFPEQSTKDLKFDLGNRQISDETVIKSVTLGDLADLLFPSSKGGISDGNTQVFPAISNEKTGIINLDSMTNFDWLDVSTGYLQVNVENNFPVPIDVLNLTFKNVDDDAVIGTYSYSNLNAGTSQTKLVALDNKLIQNEIYVEITDFSTSGSNPSSVLINFADDIVFTISALDIRVKRGRAILPDQVFDSDTTTISLDLTGDEELTQLNFATGSIKYQLYSYVNENVAMSIELPNTIRNGSQVTKYTLVNAQGAGPTFDSIVLSNSSTMLVNNEIPAIYTTLLVSSNQMIEFDFTDTVNYNSTIQKVNITVESALGYFGSDTIQIANESFKNELDLFSKFQGSFELTNPQINIVYTNSYGIPLDLQLDFEGIYNDGDNVNLGAPLVSFQHPTTINDDPHQGVINFNKNNLPQIVDFLKFPPADEIAYSGYAVSNPGGKTALPNFINNVSEITVGVQLKLPLELRATDVMLQDTLNFSGFSNTDETTADEGAFNASLTEASLAYKVKNGFPFELDFQIILYDSIADTKFDTVDIGFIDAAAVNNNGIVIPESIEERSGAFTINEDFLDNLTENTNKIIIIGRLNTSKDDEGNTKSVKILTSYEVEFHAGLIAKTSVKKNSNSK